MKIIPGKYKEEPNWQKWVKFIYSHGDRLSIVFLRRLAALARDLGHVMNGTYGYRPMEETQRLYDADLKANKGKPSGRVAIPGTSWHEHHLAIDLSGTYDSFWRNLSNTQWVNKTRLKQPLNAYGLMLPLNKIDSPNNVEWWHLQPIETVGVAKDQRKNFLDPDDEIYGGVKVSVIKIQRALKEIGLYTGAIDGKAGPLTRKAMNEFYPMLQEVMQIPDGLKLKKDMEQMKNDIRVAKNALSKW